METKDLVLLMMIPIILISIVTYVNISPTITGAATAQQEKSNIIGTYSINPSFKVNFDYKFDDEYKKIKDTLDKEVIDKCFNQEDKEKCFASKAAELKWNCENKNKIASVLYDFVDKFNECLNLEENGVVCRFSFDEREMSDRIFTIKLTPENERLKAELIELSNVLETAYINLEDLIYVDYNDKDGYGSPVDSVSISIKYLSNKPEVTAAFAQMQDSLSKIDLGKSLLYKDADGVKFIDLAEEGNFRAPIPANKIIDLLRTKIFKFCAKTAQQFYAYDKSDNTVKLRDIILKFAVKYPIPLIPPPVKTLKAEDKLKAEKSIVLKWNKAKWEDGTDVNGIDHYNIYCSKNSFEDKSTKEIKLGNLKPTLAVKSDTNYDIWNSDINKCGKENIQDDTDYYFAVTDASNSGKESSVIVQSSAKSVDDLAPGVQQIVLINSDGKKEKKLSSACISLPKTSASGTPGNIWAGFFAPDKNEDDATAVKAGEQLTYHLFFSKQIPLINNLDDCSDSKKCVKLTFAPNEDTSAIQELDERRFNKFREINQPNQFFEEGQDYCFTVIAKDQKNNIIKNLPYKFEKPQQWVEMESKPVIKGTFNEQNEVIYS